MQSLAEHGLVAREDELHYFINLTVGESIAISAYGPRGDFFQIKASEFIDVRPEFEALTEARALYPLFVPRTLAYFSQEGWSVMVSEGVRHSVFSGEEFFRHRHSGVIIAQLQQYFRTQGQRKAPVGGMAAELLRELSEGFSGTAFESLAAFWLRRFGSNDLEALGQVPQHGDFCVNNLAYAAGGLVIFDWEDFGKVKLAGLDLCSLYLTVTAMRPDAVHALASPAGTLPKDLEDFLREACGGLGIAFETFRRLMPFYMLIFLYLKRNYGLPVQERIAALLRALAEHVGTAAEPLAGGSIPRVNVMANREVS